MFRHSTTWLDWSLTQNDTRNPSEQTSWNPHWTLPDPVHLLPQFIRQLLDYQPAAQLYVFVSDDTLIPNPCPTLGETSLAGAEFVSSDFSLHKRQRIVSQDAILLPHARGGADFGVSQLIPRRLRFRAPVAVFSQQARSRATRAVFPARRRSAAPRRVRQQRYFDKSAVLDANMNAISTRVN